MKTILSNDVGVTDAIFHRRAVRSYSPRVVEPATVESLLLAAVQAPSAMNHQPWGFAVVHGRRRLQDLGARVKNYLVATYPSTFETHPRSALYENPEYDIFHGASTLIVIYATSGPLKPNEDCCLAAENLMLAAYGMGLGTCPIGFARDWLNLVDTKHELGIPDHYTAVFPLVLGYPAAESPPTPRDAPYIVCWEWDPD